MHIISYIGFRQVIRAHITCLCFVFPEPKAREIYNADRLYEPIFCLFDILIGKKIYNIFCHTARENLSDPIGYLLDFTNPYYTALAGNMKARAKKDNSF
jgi:hypothetical protein